MSETNVAVDAEAVRERLKEIGTERVDLVAKRLTLVAIRDRATGEVETVAAPFKSTVEAYAAALGATVQTLDTHLAGLLTTAGTIGSYVTEQVSASTETGAALDAVEVPALAGSPR